MQLYKCICAISVPLKYLITLYGRLLKNWNKLLLLYRRDKTVTDQEKADTFSEYLVRIFIFNIKEVGSGEEEAVFSRRKSRQSQTTEATRFTKGEITAAISKHLNAKKTSGYDLITGRILKELPELGLNVTYLFNTINLIP